MSIALILSVKVFSLTMSIADDVDHCNAAVFCGRALTDRSIMTPELHVYLTSHFPLRDKRSRRYVALQLEYYTAFLDIPIHQELLREATLIWEYSRAYLPRWNATMPAPAVYVRCACSRS